MRWEDEGYTIEEIDLSTIPAGMKASMKRYAIFKDGEEICYCSTFREAQRVLAIIRSTDRTFGVGLGHFEGFK